MGATYTRQSTYEDGDTITAAHTNDEFDQLLAAFQASTGHTHDGTANEGGPINKLLSNTLTFGAATSGTDITITFDGETNDGVLAWMEDEDYFKFSDDIMIIDDEKLIFGSDSNVAVSYDEATTDSLKIAATEGAGLAITLMADEGDDAGDEWKLNIADGGTLTLGNDINSAGTYVTHLTITPNSTVASSTMAVAGNLTVGGSLTLGSGAVLAEAELEMLDGITAGTVAASKAVVVDANKDAASFRNITLTGELDAGSLDVSGDADIDGTLEADAITVDGTALATYIRDTVGTNMLSSNTESGIAVTYDTTNDNIDFAIDAAQTGITSILATDLKVGEDDQTKIDFETADEIHFFANNVSLISLTNENSGDAVLTVPTADKNFTIKGTDGSSGITALDIDMAAAGDATFNNKVIAAELDISGDVDVDGTLEADAMTLNGTAITTTATKSTGISSGNVPVFTSGVADNDFLRVDGTSIEGRSASEVLSDISAAPAAGDSNILTTGALDSGSITSGFGAIDNGTSGIRTNTFTAETSIVPDASGGADLGSTSAEWGDFYIADDKYIFFGNDQNVKVGYDEDGNDALEFKSNIEGAALALTFSADEADDNADTWRLSFADGGTVTWDSYTGGSFATKLTLDTGGNLLLAGELQATNIGYTDGDNAITIADGGGITAANGITSTAASNTLGATSFNDANITNVGDIALDSITSDAGNGTAITFSQGVVPNTETASKSGTVAPDMSRYTNFVWTLGGNLVLDDPTDEVAGQSGVFVFIQDGTGSRTLSHADDRYFVAGGTSITLTTTASAVDIVPYFVQADGKIHLGAAQLAFAEA